MTVESSIVTVNGKDYKVYNGMFFNVDTADSVMFILSRRDFSSAYGDSRLRLYYGNTETGEDWQEEFDVTGYIGRSTGTVKIPLLIHNRQSMGGGGILTHCIVKIEYANKKDGGILYQHHLYHIPQ